MEERISVCMPVYNAANTVLETLCSILDQTFKDFEVVIVDNASTDNTVELVRSIKDSRIKLYINETNIGAGNFAMCKLKAEGDILFYLSDDIAAMDALEKVYNAFKLDKDIAIVTRPYFWFEEDVTKPVRLTRQYQTNQIISLNSSYRQIRDFMKSCDQISGVAFRKKYMDFPFGVDSFVEMGYGAIPLLKKYKAVILKDNIVAIRIGNNGSKLPEVYKKSPMLSWHNLVNATFLEDKYNHLRRYLINNFVANNYIGLVQIKNFGGFKALLREIYYMVKLRWQNIFNPSFWFFALSTIIIPAFILRRAAVFYKNSLNSRLLKVLLPVKFNYKKRG